MKISEVDKNFEIKKVNSIDFKLIKVPSDPIKLFGVLYDEEHKFHRMDVEVAKKVSPGVEFCQTHTAGGRLAFSTNSKNIYVKVEYFRMEPMSHMALTGSSGFVLTKVINGKYQFRGTVIPSFNETTVESSFKVSSSNGYYTYLLFFPLYNNVKSVTIGIDSDAEIKEPVIYKKHQDPILYYGSSITQGGCASRPDNSYQAYISEKYDVDFINLGFSGNAKGEEEMSRYLAKQKTGLFVLDYDYNSPSSETLFETHQKLFDTFRKSHPTTPVIMISKPDYHSATGDKLANKKRRDIIYATYKNAINNGDKNVYFIDGGKIYPSSVREHCAVDGGHPTDLGFYFFAKAIIKIINKNKLL